MRVLIIEDDAKFQSILTDCLEPEGWDVAVAENEAQALSHFRARPADVVLTEVKLQRGGSGVAAAERIRELPGGAEVPIVLTSAYYRPTDPEIRAVMQKLSRVELIRKPFSVFDLRDQLVRLAGPAEEQRPASIQPAPGEGDTAASPSPSHRIPVVSDPVDYENVRELGRLWADRVSGVLEVTESPSGNDGYATLSMGGPLDSAGTRILHAALHGGTLKFTAGTPSGEGDHNGFGARLYEVLCYHTDKDFLDGKEPWVMAKTSRYGAARSLPLSSNVRLFLGLLHEGRTVGEIVEDLGLSIDSIGPEVACLARLKVIEFASRAGDDFTDDEPTNVRKKLLARKKRLRKKRQRKIPVGAAVAPGPPPARETPGKILERLRREVPTLRGASPPAVLGLPKKAGLALAKQAQQRHHERFQAYLENDDIADEARALSLEMIGLVDEAVRMYERRLEHWRDRELERAEPELAALIQRGRDHVFAEKWKEAEKVLEQAQDIKLDNATVLGLLAWTRLHHPDYDPEERKGDAEDMLLLSEQFDMNDPTAQYYLARFYYDAGDYAEAAPRVVRAAKALPKNPHIGALMSQVKQAWNAPDVEIDDSASEA